MPYSGRIASDSLPTAVGADSPVEAAVLLRRTGAPIASWSRSGAAMDVVSVMAATLYGSIETMVGVLGGPAPANIYLETDLRRMLLSRTDAQSVLILIAPRSVSPGVLRREAQRIREALTGERPMAEHRGEPSPSPGTPAPVLGPVATLPR